MPLKTLTALVVGALLVSACDPGFNVEGVVTRHGGEPVAGAQVAMRCPEGLNRLPLEGTTNGRGKFVFPHTLGCIDVSCVLNVVAPDGTTGSVRVLDSCTKKTFACGPGCSVADVRIELP